VSQATARPASRALSHGGPRLTGRAAGLFITLGLLVLLALVPARALLAQRATMADLERRAAELEQRNAELRQEISRLNDPAELERLARECLGMVGPGEIALVPPDANPDRADC
jgi:cell division protein FtsB